MNEEQRRKDRERRAATRALYIAVYGSTRLLRGPERRPYNSQRRAQRRLTHGPHKPGRA